MSFSFGFFEGVDNLESGDRVPTTSGVNECTKISFKPWWIRIAEDAALAKQNHSNCLRFINREEFLSFQQAYQMTGIVPHQTNTTIRIDETFEVNVVRPDKEMKVDDVVTDLIPGLYEGGYKLWECSIDLAEYLARNHCSLSSSLIRSINSQPLRILELGCGIGVPGIVGQALLPLGTQLWLSDFNDSVLLETTWPTLEANALPNQHADTQAVRYTVAGDWLKLSAWLKEHNEPPFDLILSAETLYSPSHCEKVKYTQTHPTLFYKKLFFILNFDLSALFCRLHTF